MPNAGQVAGAESAGVGRNPRQWAAVNKSRALSESKRGRKPTDVRTGHVPPELVWVPAARGRGRVQCGERKCRRCPCWHAARAGMLPCAAKMRARGKETVSGNMIDTRVSENCTI